MKLAIGQGEREEWITIDADPGQCATHRTMVPPLPPLVKVDKFAEIEMIHFLEHLYYWDAISLLKECTEMLELGGLLVIECPNIEWCCKHLLGQVKTPSKNPAENQFDLWGFYGDPTREQPLYGHRWGWTPKSLEKELHSIGEFEINHETPKYHNPVRDFRVVAKLLKKGNYDF